MFNKINVLTSQIQLDFFFHLLRPANSMVDAMAKQGVDRISHFILLLLCTSGRV